MSKSVLYAVNSQPQILAIGGIINFGNIVRRYGCNLDLSNGNVVTKGVGYYSFDANLTFEAGATGDAIITFYKDGVAIPGAIATLTVATGDTYQITVPFMTRVNCCCDSIITAVITGVTATIENAAILVEKE